MNSMNSLTYGSTRWGWQPPQFELHKDDKIMLFYHSEQKTEIVEHYNQEELQAAQEAAYAEYNAAKSIADAEWEAKEAERKEAMNAELAVIEKEEREAWAAYNAEKEAAMAEWNKQEAERQHKIHEEIEAAMQAGEMPNYEEIEAKYPAIPEPVIPYPETDYYSKRHEIEEKYPETPKPEIAMPEINYDDITKEQEEVSYWMGYTVSFTDKNLWNMLAENSMSEQAQREILNIRIAAYDSSMFVNNFSIGGYNIWLDKDTRVGLKLRFDSEILAGKTSTTLWQDGMPITLPLTGDASAFAMLAAIELYASACYDNTQSHIAAARQLATSEELMSYDYTENYPQKLSF